MHDGAPAHYQLAVRSHLTVTFHHRWIGWGEPRACPPRSPDLNPLDFCIWGYLKEHAYAQRVDTVDALRHRVENAFENMRENAGLCERLRASLRRRSEACCRVHGGHFEHLL